MHDSGQVSLEHLLLSWYPTLSQSSGSKVQVNYMHCEANCMACPVPVDPDDPLHGEVLVVVLNNKPGTHKV